MTETEYLEALRAGVNMKFKDLMTLIDAEYQHTPAAFKNGDLENRVDENQSSAKLFCFAAIHQLSPLETLHCFGEHYQTVLNNPKGNTHPNIRHFMTYGWAGLKFNSPVLSKK